MHLLVDFFPLIAFFASYKLGGIYVATGVLIVACTLQIAWHWWRTHTVKTLHWVTAVLVLVFGSATLLLQDSRFIQWKLSVLMGILAVSFLVSHFMGARTLTQRFLESAIGEHVAPVSATLWHRLNLAWVAFFALVGAANLYVAYHFSEATWVNFKVIGVNVLLLLFLVPQVFWLMPKEPAAAGDAPSDTTTESDGTPDTK